MSDHLVQDSFSDEVAGEGSGFGRKQAKCIRCNRPLSDPKSVEIGMGKICASNARIDAGGVGPNTAGNLFLYEPHIREKVVVRMAHGRVATNVPNAIGHTGGYAWGNGGSESTSLAMNIVEIALAHTNYDTSKKVDYGGKKMSALAWSLGHGFKAQFLVSMPKEGGEIPWSDVMAWIDARMGEAIFGEVMLENDA